MAAARAYAAQAFDVLAEVMGDTEAPASARVNGWRLPPEEEARKEANRKRLAEEDPFAGLAPFRMP